jgi:hypothetical protein
VVYRFVPRRGDPKTRYCVVYTPDSIIAGASHIDVVMISKSFWPGDPNCIPLPFHPDGNVCTKLQKPSAIILAETASVERASVTPTWGYIPAAELTSLISGLKRLSKL